MSSLMSHLMPVLSSVPAPWAYALVGALVFAEAALFVGFVLPGETAVLLGGAMAASGRLSLPGLILVVVGAAIVGDTVGYEVGRHAGPRLLDSRPLRRHRDRLEAARTRLREKGGASVFASRFTALLRAVMPALCGMSRMPYRRFLLYNAAGGIVWGTGVTVLGYLAGRSYHRVETSLGGFGALLLLLFLGAGVLAWHRGRRKHAAKPAVDSTPVDARSDGATTRQ